jgi:glutamine cyclotransferase
MTERERLQAYARELLLARMRELSERCYCAGWITGLEEALWELSLNGGGAYGMDEVTVDEAAELQQLAVDADGWWVYGDDGVEFVSLCARRHTYHETKDLQ